MRALLAASLLALAACTDAVSYETGGELRFDAAAPLPPAREGGCGDAEADAGNGHAWSDLYRDYFGPTGVANCALNPGGCHGEPSGLGSQASNNVCAGGVTGCYTGITKPSAGLVSVGPPTDAGAETSLYLTLRKACGGGIMPKQPASFAFSPADMKRITDWIDEGAPNH